MKLDMITVPCDQCKQPVVLLPGQHYGILCRECSSKNSGMFQQPREKCMFDNFKVSDGPLELICTCPKCSVR